MEILHQKRNKMICQGTEQEDCQDLFKQVNLTDI